MAQRVEREQHPQHTHDMPSAQDHSAHPHSLRGRGFRPGGGKAAQAFEERTGIKAPRIIAWEITRSCNLSCAHCRAAAHDGCYSGELSLDQIKAVIDDITSITNPILILTGGEPLLRSDIGEIADYARAKGAVPVVGTNATTITDEVAQQLAEHGIRRISVSIDFPDAQEHDRFRGQDGAFDAALRGIECAERAGIGVQINTTVTKLNAQQMDAMHDLAVSVHAEAFHPFLLVPTGRGEDLRDVELTPEEYEEVLNWAYDRQKTSPLHFKPTDAPQYYRILHQRAQEDVHSDCKDQAAGGFASMTRGCLGGITFCFISHTGDVQPCGYFDMQLGNVLEQSFSSIWETSPVFTDLRDFSRLKGKCGACEYKKVCGGCRARALSATGDYLAEEPYCAYIPRSLRVAQSDQTSGSLGEAPKETESVDRSARINKEYDARILTCIQTDYQLTRDPYAAIGLLCGMSADAAYESIRRLYDNGDVRRIGAVLDSKHLGYTSTLCAMAIDTHQTLERAIKIINSYDEVTHNYVRTDRYNVWFTLIAPTRKRILHILAEISQATGVTDILELPATDLFKIRVDFDCAKHHKTDGPSVPMNTSAHTCSDESLTTPGIIRDEANVHPDVLNEESTSLSAEDRALIMLVQGDIGSSSEPFDELASRMKAQGFNLSADDCIHRLRTWKKSGLIRRFGAVVRHQKLGFVANAMTVWNIPDNELHSAGTILSSHERVSHCYARPRRATWPYNCYAMIHGHSCEECQMIADKLTEQLHASVDASIKDPRLLFSTRECKKQSMHYNLRKDDVDNES
ncbi:MAG: radical SAM protein [Eggerthellaceae bacterium]|jgi:heme b synthase|nr:radical SAM protein [Eggerthellaceae bacterium]